MIVLRIRNGFENNLKAMDSAIKSAPKKYQQTMIDNAIMLQDLFVASGACTSDDIVKVIRSCNE